MSYTIIASKVCSSCNEIASEIIRYKNRFEATLAGRLTITCRKCGVASEHCRSQFKTSSYWLRFLDVEEEIE